MNAPMYQLRILSAAWSVLFIGLFSCGGSTVVSDESTRPRPRARSLATSPFQPRLPRSIWTPESTSSKQGVLITLGPCAFSAPTIGSMKVPVWGFVPKSGGVARLPRQIQYGQTPSGYRQIRTPARLTEGCYCLRMGRGRVDFEVRDRRILTPCQRWSRPDLVLPLGRINAYSFGQKTRSEVAWYVRPDGRIRVVPPELDDDDEETNIESKTIGKLISRWQPATDPPLFLEAPMAGKPPHRQAMVRPARIRIGPTLSQMRDYYVRWIGSHGDALRAALLVPHRSADRIILLNYEMISQHGIFGVMAHGLGDLDGDGRPDLVLVYLPCCDSGPRGIMGEFFLTRGGTGIVDFTLESNADFLKLTRRLKLKDRFYENKRSSRARWRITTQRNQVTIRLHGKGRWARRWKLQRTGSKVRVSRTDYQVPDAP